MNRYIIRNIGENRGAPRIYLDLPALAKAGFVPGETYSRTVSDKCITLTLADSGDFKVSSKGAKAIPLIDINSSEALKPFEGMSAVKITLSKGKVTISELPTEAARHERLARLGANLAAGSVETGSLAHGVGVMDFAAHSGFEQAGLSAHLAVANEIDEDLLQQASERNSAWSSDTVGLAAPMQELMVDPMHIPKVDVLVAGIPCSGASVAGKSKRGLSMMENHPEVGHLIAPTIALIARMNPAVVVIENVIPYAATASAQILRQTLRDLGYNVAETELAAQDFGSLENRNRWALVASTVGLPMDIENLPHVPVKGKLGDILDVVPDTDPSWSKMEYLIQKEITDREAGKGFAMQLVDANSTKVSVIGKGYQKNRSTEPKLMHPKKKGLLRLLTVNEHARLKGVPEELVAGMGKTEGHIALGQSVDVRPLRALFKRIGEQLRSWDGVAGPRAVPYSLGLKTG